MNFNSVIRSNKYFFSFLLVGLAATIGISAWLFASRNNTNSQPPTLAESISDYSVSDDGVGYVDFFTLQDEVGINQEVNFVVQTKDLLVQEYLWNFGDGTTVTTTVGSTMHTYSTAGTYEVQLTAIDELGSEHKVAKTQTVENRNILEPKLKQVVPGEILVKTTQGEVLNLNVAVGSEAAAIKSLQANPQVEIAEPNIIFTIDDWNVGTNRATPNDYNSSSQWYFQKEQLPEAWKLLNCPNGPLCGGSSETVVGIIDTGVAYENFDDRGTAGVTDANFLRSPDFNNLNLYTNTDEVPDDGKDNDCNGYIDDYHGLDSYWYDNRISQYPETCDNDGNPYVFSANGRKEGHPVDTYGHGTTVANQFIASTDNGTGIASPAFNVKLLPMSVTYYFSSQSSGATLYHALQYARHAGVDVLNISMSASTSADIIDDLITRMVDDGMVIVATSGNNGNAQVRYPAGHPDVISVGSVNPDGSRSSYSNYPSNLDLVAYVGDENSNPAGVRGLGLTCASSGQNACNADTVDDGFTNYLPLGTSFAAPQVSGLAALIKSINPDFTAAQVKSIMTSTADDLGANGRDNQTGYGVINFYEAVNLALEQAGQNQSSSSTSTTTSSSSTSISSSSSSMTTSSSSSNTATIQPANPTEALFRFYRPSTLGHLYTNRIAERNKMRNREPFRTLYNYENEKNQVFPKVLEFADPNAKKVYRAFNIQSKTHRYTINTSLYNSMNNNTAQWLGESYKFHAYATQIGDSVPFHEFYNSITGGYFYTSREGERRNVERNLPQFQYQGISFYVFPKE